VSAGESPSGRGEPGSIRDRFIGVWELVSAEYRSVDGSTRAYPPAGPRGKGYLIYTADGHMCVELMNPDRPKWKDFSSPTETEKISAFDGFSAYCGTYEIEEAKNVIYHLADVARRPDVVGARVPHPYTFRDGLLTFSNKVTSDPAAESYVITWRKGATPADNSSNPALPSQAPVKQPQQPMQGQSGSVRNRFIGTWEMVSNEDHLIDGSARPFPTTGPHGKGHLMYTADGYMCAELMNPDRPAWKDLGNPSDAEKASAMDGFSAYCGRYEIDESNRVMYHYPELAWSPNYVGTKQRRPYKFSGDLLTFSDKTIGEPGVESYVVVWRKSAPLASKSKEHWPVFESTANPEAALPAVRAEGGLTVPAGKHAVLVDNIGTYSRKISTNSPQAQKFFDQGLRLTFGYYFPEAIASFQEAQQHDPDHPMLDWGLALAMGPNPNSRKTSFPDDPYDDGKRAMVRAREHLARATPVERALIEALSVRYDTEQFPDRATRDEKFIEAARSVADRFPNDMEAQFLYADAIMIRGAWNYWRRDGSPLPGTREAAAALDNILAIDPNHPGAVHLYVHLFEPSSEPERALPHADRLESTMPKEGHMAHMPSHIYVRVGQYDKAVATNERSIADDAYFLSQWGNLPFPTEGTYHISAKTHAAHSHDVLRYAAIQQGNYARALQAARETGVGHTAANPRQQRLPKAWMVHRAFGKWQALLGEPAPPADKIYLNAAWHYLRGSAFAGLGDFEKAENEFQALTTASRDPALKDVLSGANSASSIVAMLTDSLAGEIALHRHRYEDAISAFEKAVTEQDALSFNEPPDGEQSMRLYLGAALLKAGRAKDAEAVYREELRNLHENGWALFGLWQSLRDQALAEEARQVREQFDRAWKNADVTLSASAF